MKKSLLMLLIPPLMVSCVSKETIVTKEPMQELTIEQIITPHTQEQTIEKVENTNYLATLIEIGDQGAKDAHLSTKVYGVLGDCYLLVKKNKLQIYEDFLKIHMNTISQSSSRALMSKEALNYTCKKISPKDNTIYHSELKKYKE